MNFLEEIHLSPPNPCRPTEDKFKILFDHSSDPHLIISEEGILDCNAATIQLLGGTCKKDILKIHPAELSPPVQPDGRSSREKSREMDRIAFEKGFHRFEWTHRKVCGEDFPVQVTLNAVTIDGKPSLIVVWHDLTELKSKELELRRANEKMKRDLAAASVIQKTMLPVSSPLLKGLRAAWSYQPCDELGGDSLNIFPLDEKNVGLYVLDVAGHGLAASLLSVAASHFLSPYSEASFVRRAQGTDKLALARPAEVAEKLNQHFSSNPEQTQLFTLLYGILNVESYEFCYVCAGHPTPIVVSKDGKSRMIAGSGMPIGVTQDFNYSELCLKLKPNDRLYLYSDGVTEAKSARRDFFGEDRMMQTLAGQTNQPLPASLDAVLNEVESWCRPEAPDDDVTLLACEIV